MMVDERGKLWVVLDETFVNYNVSQPLKVACAPYKVRTRSAHLIEEIGVMKSKHTRLDLSPSYNSCDLA